MSEWYLTEDHSLSLDFIIPDLQEALQLTIALKILPEENLLRDEVGNCLAVICTPGLEVGKIRSVITPTLNKVNNYFISQYSLLAKSKLI